MRLYFLALAVCVVVVVFLVAMLRTRRLKEKYAIAWLVLALGVCVVGAFPAVVVALSDLVGVATPSNLLFAAALAVLLGVCIQMSAELTTLEEETRTLAEEVAMLRLDIERRLPATESAESMETGGRLKIEADER